MPETRKLTGDQKRKEKDQISEDYDLIGLRIIKRVSETKEDNFCTGEIASNRNRSKLSVTEDQDFFFSILSIEANNFDINPSLINLVEKNPFGGEDYEDPHDFMDRFLRICDTTKQHGVSDDEIRLRLFPFALTGKTLRWLDRQAPNIIRTWDDLAAKFFAEHFSREKYNKLVNEITNFIQQPGETLCTSWARFQELIRKCPQYDFPDEKKVRVFYNGMIPDTRMIVNGAAGGTIGRKTTAETLELIHYMARTDNASMEVQPVQSKRGILQLGNNDASLAKKKVISQQLASLNAKLDKMQISTSKVNVFNCEYCKEPHDTNECPTLNRAEPFQVIGIWYDPRTPQNTQSYQRNQNGGQGNNFQRRNQGGGLDYNSNNYLQPPLLPHKEPFELEKVKIQLSKTTNDHINETRAYHKNQDASIRNLETQIGQLSRQLAERSQGTIPSDTIVNPREHCNAITTKSEELEKEEVEASTGKNEHTQEEALEQMPSYAKFLKETLSKKRKLTEDEPITLTEECSAILEKNMPPKLKDP
ncbi:uncharacterized protein LOC133303517 [Gastrolobium bilobum]|uniref:uncharacterized protein LOC133303517 n=1 Tax=Gastrolobium bilobum TaxID=150636 RepID=UPI002AB11651|nr:uncharacterized protein LOC133303517 [Gastrolobium bilobum]